MADCQDRVVTALNLLMGKDIGNHLDGCNQTTLALINDYFSMPMVNEEFRSLDSEGLAVVKITKQPFGW